MFGQELTIASEKDSVYTLLYISLSLFSCSIPSLNISVESADGLNEGNPFSLATSRFVILLNLLCRLTMSVSMPKAFTLNPLYTKASAIRPSAPVPAICKRGSRLPISTLTVVTKSG